MREETTKKSGLLGIIVIVLLIVGGLVGFVLMENRELGSWTDPADTGEFVVAIRVDRGDWQEIDDAGRQVTGLLPDTQAGDGHSGLYQGWRGSGWRRISRHIVDGVSLQELADKSAQFASENCRIYVIDSDGSVYLPRN